MDVALVLMCLVWCFNFITLYIGKVYLIGLSQVEECRMNNEGYGSAFKVSSRLKDELFILYRRYKLNENKFRLSKGNKVGNRRI